MEALRAGYSFTELKHIRWEALSEPYAEQAAAAESEEEFADAVAPMLGHLRDLHVWIELPDGRRIYPYRSGYAANYDRSIVRRRLTAIGSIAHVGRTADRVAVLVLDSLPEEGPYEQVLHFVESASLDCRGFVVDLRSNAGGSEPRGAEIAGCFIDVPRPYAMSSVRNPESWQMLDTHTRVLQPSGGRAVKLPVVCLIGPGCVSSGEGMALMMKAAGATMIGQPTRGASGNPRPVTLSNGVRVWFSRWVSLELDGTPIEGRGIQPEERIEHVPGRDPTFERGVQLLKRGRG